MFVSEGMSLFNLMPSFILRIISIYFSAKLSMIQGLCFFAFIFNIGFEDLKVPYFYPHTFTSFLDISMAKIVLLDSILMKFHLKAIKPFALKVLQCCLVLFSFQIR